jgi:hypothetical protein
MNNAEKVKEYYNAHQDKFTILSIDFRKTYPVSIGNKRKKLYDEIGFYEFLFNPKYGVSKVFSGNCWGFFDYKNNVKHPPEILKYLSNSIKEEPANASRL